MKIEELKDKLSAELSGVTFKVVCDSLLIENPADLPKVARHLKNTDPFKLDYLSSVTASDFIDYLECVYHLYSMEAKNDPVTLRVRVKKDKPNIPSLVSIYRGAEFQEREAYDMYGVIFDNHPDLRRIFMWEGYEGYPMRKDYQQEDSETLETADIEWLDKNGVKVDDAVRAQAEELKKQNIRAIAKKPAPGA